MRFVDFFFIAFGISLTSVYVHSKPTHSYSTLLLPNDIIRVKKRHEDSSTGYLEQCGIVKFPKAQQGVVNVLAFLDSSWPYSHRQAIMLKMLNERLRRSGLPDTLFFVVNVDPSYSRTVDNAEDEIEREAWLGVSPDEIETFADIVKTTDSLAMSMTPEIQLIQDNEDLKIWKELRGSRDQVLVIDRCGKLTYQVIVPWSILHFPYVKAAILSTYKDEPCGPCDVIHNARDPIKYHDDFTPQSTTLDSEINDVSTTEEYFQNDKQVHVQPSTTESYLRSDEESSTMKSQSASTPNYSTDKSIDVTEDVETTTSIFGDTENYTEINVNTEEQEELTSLTTTVYMTTEDPNKIEVDFTTFDNTEATDSTNIVTFDPTSDYKITSGDTTEKILESQKTTIFQSKEKSKILQNKNLPELKNDDNSRNINTTDSTFSVSYYDTTARIYTKSDEDKSMEKNVETDTKKFFNNDEKSTTFVNEETTQSFVEKYDSTTFVNTLNYDNFEDLNKNPNFMVDAITEKIVNSNSKNFFPVDEESDENKDSEKLQDRPKKHSEIEDNTKLMDMPLRIIMHAPHFHVDGDSTRMHEYLVLKTGTSDYHRHLASYDATRLYRGPQDFQETSKYPRNHEIESKKWPMTSIIYNRDESPGLYGEIADYWKNSGAPDNYDYNEETENPGVEENSEEPNADEVIFKKPPKTDNKNIYESVMNFGETTISNDDPDEAAGITENLQADFAHESITENQAPNDEVLNVEEEETRSKLIAHYSKLLPWIYYVLDK